MAFLHNKLEALLRNRGAIVTTLVGSLLLVLVMYNLVGWLFLIQFERSLERELDARLTLSAGLIARLVEAELRNQVDQSALSPINRLLLRKSLEEIRLDYNLQNIHLIDRNETVMLSLPEGTFLAGERIPYLVEDSTRLDSARSGYELPSSLHEVEGFKFKSGYAPVQNLLGQSVAIVVVEASATFFSKINLFQRRLIVGALVSLGVIILYGVFTTWAVSYFVRLQETIQKNERLAAMGQMAATVAHEIRNPLGIIKSTAEVLRDLYQPKEEPGELFGFIPSEVDRLNRLVNDFLTFARDRELKLNQACLVETVGRAVRDLHQELKGSEAEITFSPSVESLTVRHNEDAIRQVLLNLVMNAVEAMEGKGRVTISVSTSTSWARKYAVIEVRDTGPGLPVPVEKIFEPFFTTKTRGSGLGLAVTKQIIEKHRGRIAVDSVASEGTTIRCFLPMQTGPASV